MATETRVDKRGPREGEITLSELRFIWARANANMVVGKRAERDTLPPGQIPDIRKAIGREELHARKRRGADRPRKGVDMDDRDMEREARRIIAELRAAGLGDRVKVIVTCGHTWRLLLEIQKLGKN